MDWVFYLQTPKWQEGSSLREPSTPEPVNKIYPAGLRRAWSCRRRSTTSKIKNLHDMTHVLGRLCQHTCLEGFHCVILSNLLPKAYGMRLVLVMYRYPTNIGPTRRSLHSTRPYSRRWFASQEGHDRFHGGEGVLSPMKQLCKQLGYSNNTLSLIRRSPCVGTDKLAIGPREIR